MVKKLTYKAQAVALKDAEDDLSKLESLHRWKMFWVEFIMSIQDPVYLTKLYTKVGGVTPLFIHPESIGAYASAKKIARANPDEMFVSLNAMQRMDLIRAHCESAFGPAADCVAVHVKFMHLLAQVDKILADDLTS